LWWTTTSSLTRSDIKSNLPYRKGYVVIGVDTPAALTGPPPDPQPAAGGNDTLVTFANFGAVSADGVARKHQTDTFKVARATADEDQPPIPNPDELQVRVELKPLLPTNTARESNIVKINSP
jgi:hypothetical protein